MNTKKKIVVVQLGARMHYAVPIIFNRVGILTLFITDFYNKYNFGFLKLLPDFGNGSWKKLITRRNNAIPNTKICNNNKIGLQYKLKLKNVKSVDDRYNAYSWGGKKINHFALRKLKSIEEAFNSIYVFNTAGFELMKYYQDKKHLILEQCIATHIVEKELMFDEFNKHPDWEDFDFDSKTQQVYIEQEINELKLANTIICPSDFVKNSITKILDNIDHKIKIVPYGVSFPKVTPDAKCYKQGEVLEVLTVGTVGLRKGSPYILQAAKHFGNRVRFTIVGDYSSINKTKIAELKQHINLIGHVSRSTVAEYYKKAHVFLLPSICEGSATVTYEAMQYGLPLIVTPNTGSLVRHKEEGYIIPPGDSQPLISSIEKILDYADSINTFSKNVLLRAKYATIEAYEERLTAAIGSTNITPLCM